MDKIKLKVCGMRDDSNILAVADIQPDYMGFIFYPPSPRFVGNDFQFIYHLPPFIRKVGVFVNATSQQMLTQAKRLSLDYLQLHGNETPGQCEALKKSDVKLIKAFAVDEGFDFGKVKPYLSSVDFFLFDTKGKYYGGNARTFDWNILEKYGQKIPFFLSGGISPYNVTEVNKLKGMNVHAVDVNSGVEINPGLKDVVKVEAIKKILDHE